jgi:two-component sensor histidine kinase
MRVLLVDGSAECRKLYRELLGQQVTSIRQITEAATGAEGLQQCASQQPDCALVNHTLPDMSGLEFLARLKGGGAVVILTGLAHERIAVEALKAGAQDYLIIEGITAESLALAVDKATQKVRLIRDLQAERDQLAHSVAEKDLLLKEVHHRVKNNLQVIVSLLRLQGKAIHDPRLAAALRESEHRVQSMALIHEQLYQTKDLRAVDLSRHVSTLGASLLHSYGVEHERIALQVKIALRPLAVDQAIPAGLILNELISNALKHAFPGEHGGTVTVTGTRERGDIVLEVRDDGMGLPRELDVKRTTSLGLQIVQILAQQLKGSFAVERGHGVAFRVTFPEVVHDGI